MTSTSMKLPASSRPSAGGPPVEIIHDRPDGEVEWQLRKPSEMLTTGYLQNLHAGRAAELRPLEVFPRPARASSRPRS